MSSLDALLGRLEGVKAHNGYFMALCPTHHDRDPSLSISQGDGSRILIKCHAGCTAENIVEAIGLTMRDLFNDKGGERISYPPGNGATPPTKTVWGCTKHRCG
jgi:hypothetical protein